jgi:uncharacterized YccA/Bax inhibitor family protein
MPEETMTLTRILALGFTLVLLVRLASSVLPVIMPGSRLFLRRMTVSIDIAGGFIMLLLIGFTLWRGEPITALLLAAIGIPIFLGAYRSLPEWWWGPRG